MIGKFIVSDGITVYVPHHHAKLQSKKDNKLHPGKARWDSLKSRLATFSFKSVADGLKKLLSKDQAEKNASHDTEGPSLEDELKKLGPI